MNALAPVTNLTSLKNEMDRLFDRFWDTDLEPVFTGEWMPALDLSESNDQYTLKVEVPGIEPKDIHVTLREGLLIIRGEKKSEVEKKDEKFFRSERRYGAFTRMVRLPGSVDGTHVNATFKNGVLNVVVPKAPEAKGTEIPVKLG